MKIKYPVLLAMLAVWIAIMACNFGTGGTKDVSLENLRMAFDEDGNNPTTVFSPSDIFYIVADLNNAPAGTVVEAKWRAVQIEGYESDELIYEQTINDFTEDSFTGTIYFQLSNDDGWLVGDYKAEVYLDGNFVNSVPFSVQ
jgi:hypothetical protein